MRALFHLSLRRWLPGMLAAAWLLAAGVPEAQAVSPYRGSAYQQKHSLLKKGKSTKEQRTVPFRFKAGKDTALSHHGVSPQFHRQQWSWGHGKRSRLAL